MLIQTSIEKIIIQNYYFGLISGYRSLNQKCSKTILDFEKSWTHFIQISLNFYCLNNGIFWLFYFSEPIFFCTTYSNMEKQHPHCTYKILAFLANWSRIVDHPPLIPPPQIRIYPLTFSVCPSTILSVTQHKFSWDEKTPRRNQNSFWPMFPRTHNA